MALLIGATPIVLTNQSQGVGTQLARGAGPTYRPLFFSTIPNYMATHNDPGTSGMSKQDAPTIYAYGHQFPPANSGASLNNFLLPSVNATEQTLELIGETLRGISPERCEILGKELRQLEDEFWRVPTAMDATTPAAGELSDPALNITARRIALLSAKVVVAQAALKRAIIGY